MQNISSCQTIYDLIIKTPDKNVSNAIYAMGGQI